MVNFSRVVLMMGDFLSGGLGNRAPRDGSNINILGVSVRVFLGELNV